MAPGVEKLFCLRLIFAGNQRGKKSNVANAVIVLFIVVSTCRKSIAEETFPKNVNLSARSNEDSPFPNANRNTTFRRWPLKNEVHSRVCLSYLSSVGPNNRLSGCDSVSCRCRNCPLCDIDSKPNRRSRLLQ